MFRCCSNMHTLVRCVPLVRPVRLKAQLSTKQRGSLPVHVQTNLRFRSLCMYSEHHVSFRSLYMYGEHHVSFAVCFVRYICVRRTSCFVRYICTANIMFRWLWEHHVSLATHVWRTSFAVCVHVSLLCVANIMLRSLYKNGERNMMWSFKEMVYGG